MLQVNGISIHVEDHGSGRPVLLLHGWPDSAYLWRNQIPFLVANGFHAMAPDLRGFGRSDRPEGVAAYSLQNAVGDVVGILDTLRQREMAWYQLFFQFEGIAEAWLQHDDWALLRELLRGNGDVDRYISDLSRPDALTASLNWYRANLAPRMPGSLPTLPPVEAPTLGIWSTNDHYLDGERMKMSGRFLKGPWRYEQIDGASHWIPLDASDRLNQLLIEWLG